MNRTILRRRRRLTRAAKTFALEFVLLFFLGGGLGAILGAPPTLGFTVTLIVLAVVMAAGSSFGPGVIRTIRRQFSQNGLRTQ